MGERSRGARRSADVEIELTETEDRLPDPHPAPERRALARRPGILGEALIAVLVAAALVAVMVNVGEWRRHEESVTAAASLPGALVALDEPLTELWTVRGRQVLGSAAGLVLLLTEDSAVQAVDRATGEIRWTREGTAGAPETCVPLADGSGSAARASLAEAAPRFGARDIVCVRVARASDDEAAVLGTSASLVDPETGEDVRTLMSDGYDAGWTVVEGDVVMLTAAVASGDQPQWARAVRWDPLSDEVVWRYETVLTPPADPSAPSSGVGFWRVPESESFSITHDGTATVVSLATGSVTGEEAFEEGAQRSERLVSGGGVVSWWAPPPGDSRPPLGRLTDVEGAVLVEFRGPPLHPLFEDGSVPDVLVAGSGPLTIAGFDVRSGAQLWSSDHLATSRLSAVVDRVALVVDGAHGAAVDLGTGEELWTADELAGVALGLTDGRHVLVQESADGVTALVARAWRDGREAWRVPLPGGTSLVFPIGDGALVAMSPSGTVTAFG